MAKISIDLKSATVQRKKVVVGIDLGTTNSLVAYIDSATKKPVIIEDATGNMLVPSVLFFENNELLVGNRAHEKWLLAPEKGIASVKRLMGKSYTELAATASQRHFEIIEEEGKMVKVKVHTDFYSPIELSALVLKELKHNAEMALNAVVEQAVITVPAYFDDAERQATQLAGKLAGLEVLRIINEPTAASLAYGLGLDRNIEVTIAVYDLGGGTFDITILQIHDGVFDVLSTHGDTALGGDTINESIVDFWVKKYGIASSRQLVIVAEKAKIRLSSGVEKIFDEGGLSLSDIEFEELIAPVIARTLVACERVITDAAISVDAIDEILLVGGSTRLQAVRVAVGAYFKKKPNTTLDPDTAVALGAALQADVLAGNSKEVLLLDITPLSLGIETMGGLIDVLVPRNSKMPCEAKRQYTTSKDGQSGIIVSVYQGERDLVADNRKLGTFTLSGIPAMPAGLPKVEVHFFINANGTLHVRAKELRSGVEQSIEIQPTSGITDDQIELMLQQSLQNSVADMQARSLAEAQQEAQQIIYLTTNFIEKNKDLLSETEVATTHQLLSQVATSASHADKNKILLAIELVNKYTTDFAERLMDKAVSTAMSGTKIID